MLWWCKPHRREVHTLPKSSRDLYSREITRTLQESRILLPTQCWRQEEDTRELSKNSGVESGRVERQCIKNSRLSPLIVASFIQEQQTIHFVVRTLSPAKRRRHILREPFESSPIAESCLEIPSFLPPHTFSFHLHYLPHQALPSSMKSTVNMPNRSNWNILGPILENVPVGGFSFIYSHHQPSGNPLKSQNRKLQIKSP